MLSVCGLSVMVVLIVWCVYGYFIMIRLVLFVVMVFDL